MKDFDKLTKEEIFNLTDEQIAIYKKLKWAENGIKFPVKPNEPECVEEEKPDLTVYFIRALSDNVFFLSLEEAKSVLEAVANAKTFGHSDYNSNVGYNYQYFEQGTTKTYYGHAELGIESKRLYSKELYNQMSTNLQTNNRMRKQYEKDLSEYNEMLSRATELTAAMDEKILNVRDDFNRKQSLARKFREDYLPLAGNDEDVAMNFLAKAYTLSEEDKEYILKESKNADNAEKAE
ncbi:MAG: hypothetical protein J5621_00805 [Paludibacteraceae bacterium]|nr:hypothetical protein [Paludibacteraceae bacterium]